MFFGTKQECIEKNTVPNPIIFYGDSKLKADIGIHNLEDESFKVVSVRPPMIYGKGSKGIIRCLQNLQNTRRFFRVTTINAVCCI